MKYLRRMMWYMASRLVLLTLVLAVLICGFYIAMNSGNAYILLSEGMQKRVSVALTREDAAALNNYYSVDFLNADPVLTTAFSTSSPYTAYSITDFEYRLGVEWLWGWPWTDVMECTVTERVPKITGKVKSAYKATSSAEPPEWQGGRYKVWLQKQDGQWKIVKMTQTGILPNITVPQAETGGA